MKIWIDKESKPPADDWLWVKTAYRAIVLMQIAKRAKEPVEISMDFPSVFPLISWWGDNPKFLPFKIGVHGNNKEDQQWLDSMIDKYLVTK